MVTVRENETEKRKAKKLATKWICSLMSAGIIESDIKEECCRV
jgi:hypothetical protein